MALDRARVSQDIDIDGDGQYRVPVDFFDSAAPNVILWHQTFVVSANATVPQLQKLVEDRGVQLRTFLANKAAAQAAVPEGTTIPIP